MKQTIWVTFFAAAFGALFGVFVAQDRRSSSHCRQSSVNNPGALDGVEYCDCRPDWYTAEELVIPMSTIPPTVA